MKNRLLILSSLFVALSFPALAQETRDAKNLLSSGKAAYEANNCHDAIDLFSEYLEVGNPTARKRDQLMRAIGWCSTYLRRGVIYHHVTGTCPPDAPCEPLPQPDALETEFGVLMKGYKPAS